MQTEQGMGLGALLALAGMILLLVANFQRRAGRRRPRGAAPPGLIARWGGIVAFGLMALGLLFMLRK